MKNYTKETCYKLGTQGPFLFSKFIWTEKLTCWIVNSRSVEGRGRMPQAKWAVYTKIVFEEEGWWLWWLWWLVYKIKNTNLVQYKTKWTWKVKIRLHWRVWLHCRNMTSEEFTTEVIWLYLRTENTTPVARHIMNWSRGKEEI